MGERAFAAKFWNVLFIILLVGAAELSGLLAPPPWVLAAEAMSR